MHLKVNLNLQSIPGEQAFTIVQGRENEYNLDCKLEHILLAAKLLHKIKLNYTIKNEAFLKLNSIFEY